MEKRGEAVRKYNYFDDPPKPGEEKSSKLPKIDFSKLFYKTKSSFDNIVHGDTVNEKINDIKELRELPNLQIRLMKLMAFVLFIIFIIIIIITFSHTIHSQNKKNEKYYNDAGKVCVDYITEYGSIKWETLDSDTYGKDMARMTGLCYARQMDFDNDGKDELLVCYNDKNVYTLEVWSYIGKEFSKVYSQPASSTQDELDGSWFALFHKNNKYYICQSTPENPEKVELYALKGDTFSKSSECEYDYKDNIYSIKGKINAQDFETIKLSVIKTAKAEAISEVVISNLETFSNVSVANIENQKTPEQIKADAYFEIVRKRNEKYGQAKVVTNAGKSYIDGVAMVKLIDFDGDENEELFIVYRKQLRKSATNAYTGEFITIEEPTYCMEVYGWNGSVANKIFNKDSVSNCLSNKDRNYIMTQKADSKTNICTNIYSFQSTNNYTATSRIYELKDGEFDSIYNAKIINEYGWKQYYLDNEYTYQSKFDNEGYRVPMFMNDDADVDSSTYSITYLSGDKGGGFDGVVNDTVKTIQSLNRNYSPD